MVFVRDLIRNITLLLTCSVWMVVTSQGQVPITQELDPDQAMTALNWWNASRAYPHQEIPAGAYAAAYARLQQHEQLQSRTEMSWEALGPYNIAGRMLSLAVNPLNTNSLYTGSASGGLWRSRTGGKGPHAWEPVQTGFPLLAASCIAYHPQDTNVIFVGTGEVYNFQAAGTGNIVWRTRGSYGIGILKSTDGGMTWTHALNWAYNNLRGVNKILFDPVNPDRIFAATTEGIYLSPNQGDDWFLVMNKKMVTDLIIHPTQPNLLLAAAGNLQHPDRGIYRSTDGGGVWTKVNLGFEFFGKIHLAIAPSAPDTVYASVGYAVGAASELQVSTDFGLNWSTKGDQAFTYGWFAHDVAVSPDDPTKVICGGNDAWELDWAGDVLVQKSYWQNGSFAANAPGTPDGAPDFVHQNIHEIVFDPTNSQRIFFATDGGIYLSEDGGDSFTNLNGGLQTAQFYPGVSSDLRDSTFFMGGLQNNGTAIYQGNTAWKRVIGGEGGFTAIHPTRQNEVYVGSSWLKTFRSTNAGVSFTDLPVPLQSFSSANFVSPFVMAPNHPDKMYLGADLLYRSNDGGLTIETASPEPFDSGRKTIAIAVSHQDFNKLYISTSPLTQGSLGSVIVNSPARILRSDNGGASWVDISRSLPDRMTMDLAVHPHNDQIVYAVMSGFGSAHVYKTTDGGTTWTALGQGLPDVPFQAVVLDPLDPNHVYVGGDLGAWLSRNGGQTWEHLTAEMGDPFLVTDLSVSPANRKLRMATFGRGLYQMPMLSDGVTSTASELAEARWTIAPNPAQGLATLRADLAQSTSVTVELWSLQGRKLREVMPQRQVHAGAFEWQISAPQLPAGMYLVRVLTAQGSMSLPWILH